MKKFDILLQRHAMFLYAIFRAVIFRNELLVAVPSLPTSTCISGVYEFCFKDLA